MSQLRLDENAIAPATPDAGKVILYPKSDGLWYSKDDAGTETVLSAGPGGSTTQVQFNDGGVLGGDAGLTYVKATDTLTVGNVTVTTNATVGGTLGVTGAVTHSSTTTLTGAITSNLIFTDATYDIGASGATRPRDLFLSRNAVVGGTLAVTGVATFSATPVFSGGLGAISVTTLTATGNVDFAGLDVTASNGSATFTSSIALASGYSVRLVNTHATDPVGLFMNYAGTDPNGVGNEFLLCYGNNGGTLRASIRSNGGIANFSANNVNLSDAAAKENFRPLDIPAVWAAHKDMRGVWCLYDLKDQTHTDPNMGYTAQGVRTVWAGVAPWLVDTFDAGRLGVYDHDLKNLTGAVVTELQWRSDDHEARLHALETRGR